MKFDSFFYKKQLPILIAVIVGIMAVRSSIIEPFRIPTRSMLPGLFTGDFLFVNKMEYGFHIPFSESFSPTPTYLGQTKQPKRGDIIIFTPPEAGQESLYIKRVVGIPGDVIDYQRKILSINGKAVEKTEITGSDREKILNHKGFDPEDRYEKSKLRLYRETIGQGRSYLVLEDDSFESREPMHLTVEANNYFVLGDNRDDTKDSRKFGVIPFHAIRGRAFVIWLSYRVSLNDSNWSFRNERVGPIY